MMRIVGRGVAAAALIGTLLAGAPGRALASVPSTLGSGARLASGHELANPLVGTSLVMQSNGALAEYDAARHQLWSTHTGGHPGAFAVMQRDGNLVVLAPGGRVLWASGTSHAAGAHLVLTESPGDVRIVNSTGQTRYWTSLRLSGMRIPTADTPPTTALQDDCWSLSTQGRCITAALAYINEAHAAEHLPPMVLPSGFSTWGWDAQLRWAFTSERVVRGLPAAVPSSSLDTRALYGAEHSADPVGPAGTMWGSIYAYGQATPLAAVAEWMYDDGLGSPNIDCTAAGAPGCWGHRDNIINTFGPENVGVAGVVVGGRGAYAGLFVYAPR